MNRRRFALVATGIAACGRSAAAPDSQVYMSTLPNGLPSYSNEATKLDDRLVMKWSEPPPRPRSAAEPIPAARPVRGTVLLRDPARGASAAPAPRFSAASLLRDGLDAIIRAASLAYRVEAALISAVIEVESGFNPNARSAVGATGLMQLMPATAKRYGVRDARDPVQNIDGGTRYLRDLLDLFNGDARLALAGYNAGEGAVLRHGRRIPPYAQTQAYVPKVLSRYRAHRSAASGSTPTP
jgi:soluble lytic murein transglycosylase-like protein